MKCPNCNEILLMTQRNNIEIDYCPNCRGVWLDKGELDKLLDQAAQSLNSGYPAQPNNPSPFGKHDPYHTQGYKKPFKKKSFLNDFFDFD